MIEQRMSKGHLYIVSAPSGAGKTSLVNALVASDPVITPSVSHTTRTRRPGEVDGTSYNFVDEKTFLQMVAQKHFLEHARVFGNLYGTSRIWVADQLAKGTDIVLEIDWQGARQVRELVPESISIFILPPSYEELENRLLQRGEDDPEIIRRRMKDAVSEIRHFREYDFIVVNDEFEPALTCLQSVVTSTRLRIGVQREYLASLLEDLMADRTIF